MAYNTSGTEKKIILHSPSMMQIFQKANLLAYNQASVLIYGESGVGKSFLAEYIQKSGSLSGKPFVKISCSAISEELFASELFGYSPNAFTGASASGKTGLLEAADHGTVLFDEINELSPHCQTLLLHFLQNKNITPIGSLMALKNHTALSALPDRIYRVIESQSLQFRSLPVGWQYHTSKAREDDLCSCFFFIEHCSEENMICLWKTKRFLKIIATEAGLGGKNIRGFPIWLTGSHLSENRKELIDSFIHAHCTPLHTPKSQSILHPISNAAA